MSDEPLQPSEEAREAAWPIYRWLYVDDLSVESISFEQLMEGDSDDHLVLQAFARFEALIRADQRERDAKVAEGRQQIAQDGTDLTGFYYVNAERRHVAAAIRKEPPHAN